VTLYSEAATAIMTVRQETQASLDAAWVAAEDAVRAALPAWYVTAEEGTPLHAVQVAILHGTTIGRRKGDACQEWTLSEDAIRVLHAGMEAGIIPANKTNSGKSYPDVGQVGFYGSGDYRHSPGTLWYDLYKAWNAARNYARLQRTTL